jgi:hypothetical protein
VVQKGSPVIGRHTANKANSGADFPSFLILESGFSRLREHPEGPEALSARCTTVESGIIAEVPPATSTMLAVQDSWMRLVARRASGVCFL